jgi:hypothetical protein
VPSSLLRQRRAIAKVSDRLRRDLERLQAIRDTLPMPLASELDPMLSGAGVLDEAVALAQDIECVIFDRLKPAIDALERVKRPPERGRPARQPQEADSPRRTR